jgi:hypothetical protein
MPTHAAVMGLPNDDGSPPLAFLSSVYRPPRLAA